MNFKIIFNKLVLLLTLIAIAQCTSVDIKSKVEPTTSTEIASGKSKKAAEEDLTKQEKKGDSQQAWFKEKSPIYVSVTLLKIKTTEEFCNKYEPGLFGNDLWGMLRKPDLDLRVWVREENSNIAHIANTQGFEIIQTQCGKEENARFNFFPNNPIVTRKSHLTLSLKVFENDQIITDNRKEKLNKILNDIASVSTVAVDKTLIQKTKGDTFLNYFSFLSIPIDLVNGINDFLVGEETLVTSFEINLFRDNYFLPATSSFDSNKIEVLKAGEMNNFTLINDSTKLSEIKDITAIRYEVTTNLNGISFTFGILVSKRKE